MSSEPIRQWMADRGLRRRQIRKVLSCGETLERETQFEKIAELSERYRALGNPCFSVDTKAREFLGQLYRKGRVRASQAFHAFDHDFPSLAEGVIIPHGIYDLERNRGHIAHYPSYCSKYNPIERRFFPHVGRACAGRLFDSLDTVVDLMRKAATTTGLRTTVNVMRRKYLTGRSATAEIKRNLKIVFDEHLPKWNYRAIPENLTVID